MTDTWNRGDYSISTDRARLNAELIHDFLSNTAYWATGRSLEVVERSIENSLCFGIYENSAQVGFARVVTDYATFAWIADADSRLGPLLEAFIDGKYYWVPFSRIQKIEVEPPQDLRDFVWLAAKFTWSNAGETVGFIPSRYPGTEASADDELKLARKTVWEEKDSELFLGMGQRLFATDETEIPLFDIRTIEFSAQPAAATT